MDITDFSEELNFGKYWLVLKRRWLVIVLISGATLGLATVWTSKQLPVYEATGKLLFKSNKSSNLIGIQSDSGKLEALTQKGDPLSTEGEILRSQPIIQAALKKSNWRDAKGKPLDADAVASGLSVKPVVGTDILQITYKANDPKLAAGVVNQVMTAYLKNNVVVNRAEVVAARQFIVDQLPATEAAVNQAEANLRQFKEANGILVLDQEARASVEDLSVLDKQITSAQAALVKANAEVGALRSQVGMDAQSALAMNTLNQSDGVQKALAEWQQTQAQLAKQKTLYRDGYPVVVQLQRQEAAAKAVLEQRVAEVVGKNRRVDPGRLQQGTTRQEIVLALSKAEVERLGLANELNSLVRSQAAFAARSQSIPSLEKTQRQLERQLDAAQTTYKTLLNKLQEAQVAENQTIGTARVIAAAAVPEKPIGPQVMINLLAAGLVGVLLGVSAAFLLDYADQSVKTLGEAKALFPYPLLGVIPTIGGGSKFAPASTRPQLVTREQPHFGAQEAYQMLQANLRFLTSDQPLRTIVVTSTMRQEGKSTVAANLAAAMAQGQRRVLLIDADLRHPCQHHVWDINNAIGLSNVIVGQVEFNTAVQKASSHLDVLTAGVMPPNPIALLDSQRMAALIAMASQTYDFVILDAPALSGTADATVLNKLTDGSLLVVRPGTIQTAAAKTATQFLAQSGQTVLGMVINHFDVSKEPDSYFYYTKDQAAAAPESVDRVNV
jgi:polysaccharide biosynthesis transport protein